MGKLLLSAQPHHPTGTDGIWMEAMKPETKTELKAMVVGAW